MTEVNDNLSTIASFLLTNDYELTALELFQETIERGLQPPPTLEAHFANPNFSQSLATGIRETPTPKILTEDAMRERISILEYDLRQERQSLQILRGELHALMAGLAREGDKKDKEGISSTPTLSPFEKATLNNCIQSYLKDCGFKLTAISLSNEVERDSFDDWKRLGELYGLPELKPPTLQTMYRYFIGGGLNKYDFGFKVALDEAIEHKLSLSNQVNEYRSQLSEALEKINDLEIMVNELKEEKEAFQKAQQTPPLLETLQFKSTDNNPIKTTPTDSQTGKGVHSPGSRVEKIIEATYTQVEEKIDAQNSQSKEVEEVPFTPDQKIQSLNNLFESPFPYSPPPMKFIIPQELVEPTRSIPEISDSQNTEENSDFNKDDQLEKKESDGENLPNSSELVSTEITNVYSMSKKERNFRKFFDSEDISLSNSGEIGKQVMALRQVQNSSQLIDVISQSLPRITKGVILNKREELLPVLLAAICWNPDEKQRMNLTHLLFNLIKIPNDEQRKIIMAGCVWLATLSDQDRTANELLPQCWEQIDSLYEERRILVAESCGHLAPHVKSELRLSLLLSILLDLSEDSNPQVRVSVVRNLGRLLITEKTCDNTKKYSQLEEYIIKFRKDLSQDVRDTAKKILLPIFVDWCDTNKLFREPFLSTNINKVVIIIERDISKKEKTTNVIVEKDRSDIILIMDIITSGMPQLAEDIQRDLSNYLIDILSSPEPQLQSIPIKAVDTPTPSDPIQSNANNSDSDTSGGEDDSATEGFVLPSPIPSTNETKIEAQTTSFGGNSTGSDNKIEEPKSYLKQEEGNDTLKNDFPNEIPETITNYVSLFTLEEKAIIVKQFEETLPAIFARIRLPENVENIFPTKAINLNWTVTFFIPKLIHIATLVDPVNNDVLLALCRLLSCLCICAGNTFTHVVVKYLFEEKLASLRSQIKQQIEMKTEYENLVASRVRITSLYICGVLAFVDKKSTFEVLNDLIIRIALEEDHWKESHYTTIATSITVLCQLSPKWQESLLTLLWDLVVHPANRVRSLIVKFFSVMIREVLDENHITSRVLPALITLSNDIHRSVRCSTISAFGDLATIIKSPEVQDKIKAQLLLLNERASRKIQREIVRVFGKLLPDLSDDMRDDFVLKLLLEIATTNANVKKSSKRKRMLSLLLPAFKAAVNCELSLAVKEDYVAPALDKIQQDAALLEAHDKKYLNDIQEEINASIEKEKKQQEEEKELDNQPESDQSQQKKESEKDNTSPSLTSGFSLSRFAFWNKNDPQPPNNNENKQV